MSGICIRYADHANIGIMQFACDTIDECINEAPTMNRKGSGVFKNYKQYAPMGSTCIVANNGATKVFMLFSAGWQEL